MKWWRVDVMYQVYFIFMFKNDFKIKKKNWKKETWEKISHLNLMFAWHSPFLRNYVHNCDNAASIGFLKPADASKRFASSMLFLKILSWWNIPPYGGEIIETVKKWNLIEYNSSNNSKQRRWFKIKFLIILI